MADGLRDVVKLQDPIGEVIAMWKRPNGLTNRTEKSSNRSYRNNI